MRVLIPSIRLKEFGFKSEIFNKDIPVSIKSDFLILSKAFDNNVLQSVIHHKKKNSTKVILDICDNKFFKTESKKTQSYKNFNNIKELLKYIDCVTVPTINLKKIFIESFEFSAGRVFVIDDFIDTPEKFVQPLHPSFILSNIIFSIFKIRLKISKHGQRFIWFGAAGKESGTGLEALAKNADELSRAFMEINQPSLTIVSNSYKKYTEFKKRVNFKTYYVPWDNSTINKVLKLHKVFVLPSVINKMTIGKSSNRIISAFQNELEVVADIIPSYELFANFINHPFNFENIIESAKSSRKSIRPDKSYLLEREESNLLEWVKVLKSI